MLLKASLEAGDELPFVTFGLQTPRLALLPQLGQLKGEQNEFKLSSLVGSMLSGSTSVDLERGRRHLSNLKFPKRSVLIGANRSRMAINWREAQPGR